ncbi:uncharacterized protein [Amphiura filiformis]|uniref:uncharacterized protein isoform X2 n=1 Tax=Amphiura filiformis TaxID=82378 RepID=UPI003B21DBAF
MFARQGRQGQGHLDHRINGYQCREDLRETSLRHCYPDSPKIVLRESNSSCSFGASGGNNEAVAICAVPGYVGCYNNEEMDSINRDSMTLPSMTINACRRHCRNLIYRYAMLQHGDTCFCAGVVPKNRLGDTLCGIECSGDGQQVCGDKTAFSVLDVTIGVCNDPLNKADVYYFGDMFSAFECDQGMKPVNATAIQCVMGTSTNEFIWNGATIRECKGHKEKDDDGDSPEIIEEVDDGYSPEIIETVNVGECDSHDSSKRLGIIIGVFLCLNLVLIVLAIFIWQWKKYIKHSPAYQGTIILERQNTCCIGRDILNMLNRFGQFLVKRFQNEPNADDVQINEDTEDQNLTCLTPETICSVENKGTNTEEMSSLAIENEHLLENTSQKIPDEPSRKSKNPDETSNQSKGEINGIKGNKTVPTTIKTGSVENSPVASTSNAIKTDEMKIEKRNALNNSNNSITEMESLSERSESPGSTNYDRRKKETNDSEHANRIDNPSKLAKDIENIATLGHDGNKEVPPEDSAAGDDKNNGTSTPTSDVNQPDDLKENDIDETNSKEEQESWTEFVLSFLPGWSQV